MSGIVVGVDTTDTAHRAAIKAAELATALREPLHLVMAMKAGRSQSINIGADQFFEDSLTAGEQFLRTLSAELGVADTTTAIGGRDAATSLCNEARRIDASIIVVGNKRVQGAKRVLGSIASAVTHHAHCDVLVAHTSDDPTATQESGRHSISSATVFAACTSKQRRDIDALSTAVSVPAGQELTREGRAGREFGVLLDGTATVSIDGDVVATLGAGDHFGEMALLDTIGAIGEGRSATVTADSDLWISVMSITEFSSMVARFPDVAEQLRSSAVARHAANQHAGV